MQFKIGCGDIVTVELLAVSGADKWETACMFAYALGFILLHPEKNSRYL